MRLFWIKLTSGVAMTPLTAPVALSLGDFLTTYGFSAIALMATLSKPYLTVDF